MSNALTTTQLPAHLQALLGNTSLASLNDAAAGGLSSGGWPRISIKGGKFRLCSPQGEEVLVPQFFLDVVIVGANPNASKIYYASKYDPNAEGRAPDCYSDNGVGPSSQAASPQSPSCATCPNNVWGSKISEASGKQIKACADVKKLAVLIANNTNGPVFEFRIPGDSLTNLTAYVKSLKAAKIPASAIITRISFDTNSDYPKLTFGTPVMQQGESPYITAEMLEDVLEVTGSEEVSLCIGAKDKPAQGVAPAATSVIAAQPQRAQLPPPAPTLPPALAPQTPPANTAPVEPPKRTRRTKAEMTGSAQAATAGVAGVPAQPPATPANPPPATPSFLTVGRRAAPPVSPQNAAVLAPAVTNAALDDLIAKAMST